MQYKLVIDERADLLEKAVQDLIEKGWVPIGGASVCVTGDGRGGDSWLHQQAMTSTTKSREAAAQSRDY